MSFQSLTDNQAKCFIDAAQTYEALLAINKTALRFNGQLKWRTIQNKEYLYRTLPNGREISLGRRSIDTENLLNDFMTNKITVNDTKKGLQQSLIEKSRFCKAAKIQRVPSIVTKILRALDTVGMLGNNITVVGTNALYAYEAMAGCTFESAILATGDIDLLWNAKSKLSLLSDPSLHHEGLIGVLKKADRSFQPVFEKGFRAVNKDGYFVDLIKPTPVPVFKNEAQSMGQADQLWATEIISLKWLESSPKLTQIVIGDDGFPARMTVPDPRVFSLYKYWLSQQIDREPMKKGRDLSQSIAVAQLINERLPQYPFNDQQLQMLPNTLRHPENTLDIELPFGFD